MSDAKHILIVEDEEHLAVGIRYNLEAEGYWVSIARDGKTALECLQGEDPVDLVILDLMLPEMSGYAVCETMRNRGIDIPVLILSARTLTEDRTRGFEVGADQYLTKPFDLDELLSRVRSLLNLYSRRAGQMAVALPRAREFSFGGARVNFDTYEVFVGDEKTKLTQLEMKLLQYFVDHAGRVISRNELLENVWEMPAHITTRAVDQFIRRLRRTFEPDPAHPRFFITIRDAGYRFVPEGIEEDSTSPS